MLTGMAAAWVPPAAATGSADPHPPAVPTAAEFSDEAEVTLITILPGPAVYEAFGHSALRVRDAERGVDRLYNYGTFQFDRWFVPKFLYGQLDYYLSVAPFSAAVRHYEQLGRPVIEQALDVTPAQRDALIAFLRTNAQPENRVYRYDFLFDNCSTRIRDACDAVWPQAIDWSEAPTPGHTFREMLDLYVADRPWTTFGFYLALGPQVDREVTAYEAMFLPDFLLDAADHAYLDDDAGRRPLVAATDTLLWIDGYTHPQDAFPWPAAVMWGLLGVGIVLTAKQRHAPVNWADAFDRALFGVAGTAGLLMAFLWFISLHEVTNQNLNLLWAWPTHLVAAALLGRAVLPERYLRYYWIATAGSALVVLAGWPFWPQVLYSGLIPLVMLIGLRAGWRSGIAQPMLSVTPAPSSTSPSSTSPYAADTAAGDASGNGHASLQESSEER